LLANTQASFALDYLIRSQTKVTAADEPAPKARKCKHCSSTEDRAEQTCTSGLSRKGGTPSKPCNDSSCPCCPNEHGPNDCPCPGGCALCSVTKAPCLTPLTPTLDHALCIGQCCLVESFDYVSPPQGGLIRPPRA